MCLGEKWSWQQPRVLGVDEGTVPSHATPCSVSSSWEQAVIVLSTGRAAVCRTRDTSATVEIGIGDGEVKDETVVPETENSCLTVLLACSYLSCRSLQS